MTEEWPSSDELDVLYHKAAGLFIYASTVVKFVASPKHLLTKRLTLLTSLPQHTACKGKSGVDFLYTQVLEQAFCDVNTSEEEFYSSFKVVLATMVLVFNPLSVRALSDLLKMSSIPTALCYLHSLLLVPDQDKTEAPIQPSTSHFLTFSQMLTGVGASGFLWSQKFIMWRSCFHV